MKLIGKGVFTRCYEFDDSTVLLESYDPIKRVMADGLFPKSKIFPEVKHYKSPYKKGGSMYTMHYYKGRPKRSTLKWLQDNLKPKHYVAYLTLYELRKKVDSEVKGKRGVNRQEVWNNAFATLPYKKLGKILIAANNACCEVAGNIMFDCEHKNVAVHNGNLVLLDCFYSTKELYKVKFGEKPVWILETKPLKIRK